MRSEKSPAAEPERAAWTALSRSYGCAVRQADFAAREIVRRDLTQSRSGRAFSHSARTLYTLHKKSAAGEDETPLRRVC